MAISISLTNFFIDQPTVLTSTLPILNVGIQVDDGVTVEDAEEQMDESFLPDIPRPIGAHPIRFHAAGDYIITATDSTGDTVFNVTVNYRPGTIP